MLTFYQVDSRMVCEKCSSQGVTMASLREASHNGMYLGCEATE
jgi:hypothetical protein